MSRKLTLLHFSLFLILAFLLSSLILLLLQAPRFTISSHSFRPVPVHLVLLAAFLLLLLFAFWLLYAKFASSLFGRPAAEVLAEDFLTYLPLLFLSLVPLTLSHYLSAADLLARLKLFVAAVGLSVLYLKALQIRRWSETRPRFWNAWGEEFMNLSLKKKMILLFCVSLVIYGAGAWLLASSGTTFGGDEPHYLLISHSLLRDGDFDLANNYAQQDYSRFLMSKGKMKPHVVRGARPGSVYSFHSPGISVLLLPFYALAGAFEGKAVVFILRLGMSLWGALFGLQVYLFARDEGWKERTALRLWFLTSFTSPVLFYSLHVYPEIVVAFLSLTAFRVLRFSPIITWTRAAAAGLFLSSFLWFHALKYLALLIPLFLYGLWTVGKKARPRWVLLLLILVPVAVILSYLQFQHALYGTYSLSAVSWAQPMTGPGGDSLAFAKKLLFDVPMRFRFETLAGYFLDQRDGLLLYAPLFFFALLGAGEMARKKKRDFLLLLAVASPYVLVSAFLTQRTGYAPQARPLTAVIWVMISWLGYLLGSGRKRFFTGAFNVAAVVSFLLTLLLLRFPANLYQETTRGVTERGGGLFELLSNLHFRLTDFLPSYIKVENRGWLPNFIWLAALVLFVATYFAAKKRASALKFTAHFLLVCGGIIIFFIWIVLFPRKILRKPLQTSLPSGQKATFYSLSRSARMVEPGRFQLREDGRSYRFFFTSPAPILELYLSLGSEAGDYEYRVGMFDAVFFRGRTVREIRRFELPSPPRYKLGKSSYYELVLDLGEGVGPPVELNPYLFLIEVPGRQSGRELSDRRP
ncbi:MAG: hypothetical protein AB1715_02525 [Acidobacteriota bacterium]